jgi:hypothetical protein
MRTRADGRCRQDLAAYLDREETILFGTGYHAKAPHVQFASVGPTDDYKLIPVQALDLEPQPAIAGRVRSINALRDDSFDRQFAGPLIELLPASDLMIAELQRRRRTTSGKWHLAKAA